MEVYANWESECLDALAMFEPDWARGHCEVCENGAVYLSNGHWLPPGTVTPLADYEPGNVAVIF